MAKLAAYLGSFEVFQPQVTNTLSFMEDLRIVVRQTGLHGKRTVLLLSEAGIKDDGCMELLNSVLAASVSGLFSKDEVSVMCADIAQLAIKQVTT